MFIALLIIHCFLFQPRSDLTSLIQILCCIFAEEPPVYARPVGHNPPQQPRPGYQQPYGMGYSPSNTPSYPPGNQPHMPSPSMQMPMPMPGTPDCLFKPLICCVMLWNTYGMNHALLWTCQFCAMYDNIWHSVLCPHCAVIMPYAIICIQEFPYIVNEQVCERVNNFIMDLINLSSILVYNRCWTETKLSTILPTNHLQQSSIP